MDRVLTLIDHSRLNGTKISLLHLNNSNSFCSRSSDSSSFSKNSFRNKLQPRNSNNSLWVEALLVALSSRMQEHTTTTTNNTPLQTRRLLETTILQGKMEMKALPIARRFKISNSRTILVLKPINRRKRLKSINSNHLARATPITPNRST
jgi:hypothetical protein